MNFCNDRHTPLYKVKYRPITLGGNKMEWFVCERCFGKKEFFGVAEEIESIISLRNHEDLGMNVEHILVMTNTVTHKIRDNLLAR